MLHTYIAVPIQASTNLSRLLVLYIPGISGLSAHVDGKVVKPANRPPLSSGYKPGTDLCWSLSRPKFLNETGRIKAKKISRNNKGNGKSDLLS